MKFIKQHSLIIGILLMFAYTWTIDLSNSGVLPFKVPFVVALTVGWGFIFISLLMTWLSLGKEEMVALLKRYLMWRVSWKWYLAGLLLLPALQFASVILTALLTGIPADYSRPMIREVLPFSAPLPLLVVPWFIFEILTNGEEMGWRGYILPRLQTRYSALVSSLIVGALWGVWHLPKILGDGSGRGRSLAGYVIAHIALAVLYTWLYNNTRGSLLLVTLFHASGNTAGMFLPVSFAVSGGLVENILIVLYILAACAAVLTTGYERLSHTEGKQVQA